MRQDGIALQTAATEQFLNTCPAVISFEPLVPGDARYYRFYYNDSVEVPVVPPGVWFDPAAMTVEDEA